MTSVAIHFVFLGVGLTAAAIATGWSTPLYLGMAAFLVAAALAIHASYQGGS